MEASAKGQTVFDEIDSQDAHVLDELSDEAKSLMEYAFRVGVLSPDRINVGTYQNEFSKFEQAQQVNISRFLLLMDEIAGRELSYHYVEQSPDLYSPEKIHAVKKCLIVLKLLKAISAFVRVGNGAAEYDDNIATYESLVDGYELVIEEKDKIAGKVAVVTEDSGMPNGC